MFLLLHSAKRKWLTIYKSTFSQFTHETWREIPAGFVIADKSLWEGGCDWTYSSRTLYNNRVPLEKAPCATAASCLRNASCSFVHLEYESFAHSSSKDNSGSLIGTSLCKFLKYCHKIRYELWLNLRRMWCFLKPLGGLSIYVHLLPGSLTLLNKSIPVAWSLTVILASPQLSPRHINYVPWSLWCSVFMNPLT